MANLTQTTEKARIFLTDYASYNNGTQFEFGHWVDLEDFNDADELSDYIIEHFADADEKSPLDSPREEVMITDFEGFPSSFYSESMDFENLYNYLEKLEECYYNADVVEAFADLGNYDVEDVDEFFDKLEESYQGEHKSDEDFTEQLLKDTGCIPSNIPSYVHIDWSSTARDIMMDYYENNGHYFRAL